MTPYEKLLSLATEIKKLSEYADALEKENAELKQLRANDAAEVTRLEDIVELNREQIWDNSRSKAVQDVVALLETFRDAHKDHWSPEYKQGHDTALIASIGAAKTLDPMSMEHRAWEREKAAADKFREAFRPPWHL